MARLDGLVDDLRVAEVAAVHGVVRPAGLGHLSFRCGLTVLTFKPGQQAGL
jgi:hypothetical protein